MIFLDMAGQHPQSGVLKGVEAEVKMGLCLMVTVGGFSLLHCWSTPPRAHYLHGVSGVRKILTHVLPFL